MGNHSTTRRSFLGGAATVPAAMVATVAACSAPTPAPAQAVSQDLLVLIAAADADLAASDAHHEEVYLPAHNRLTAAVAAVPHVTMNGGANVLGGEIIRTTADYSSVSANDTIVRMAREGKAIDAATVATACAFRAAHLRRERAIARIHQQSGLSQIIDDSDALNDAVGDSQAKVASFAVQTPADLVRKLAFMIERGMGTNCNWLPELLADARALANVEG